MSKSKTKKPDATRNDSAKGTVSHLAKVAAAKAARIKAGPRAIIAMLYQIADNGLKSGRASGNVYMRNGRIRKMVVPALVQNGYTTPVRSLFSTLSSSWNDLTEAQRAGWNQSTSFFKSNRFAVQFPLKGKSLYVALNANLVNTGGTPVDDCPLPIQVNGITDLSFVADESTPQITLTFTPTPTDGDVVHLVYATAPLSAGVSKPSNSAFRLIGTVPATTATGVTLNAEYVAKFGAYTDGSKIFIKLIPVSISTGQAGAAIVASSIVVP